VIDKINLDDVYERFLNIADKKKEIKIDDLLSLMSDATERNYKEGVTVKLLQVMCGDPLIPTSMIKLDVNGTLHEAVSSGNGPVDATIKAINSILGKEIEIKTFNIEAIESGSDDVSKVNMRIKYLDKNYNGYGFSTDIVQASAKAYLDAVNKFI
jgi:2-isopropylmalate synthase